MCGYRSELSTELGVQGLPTLLLFREGREVHRMEGVLGKRELGQLLSEHLGEP